MTAPTTPRSVAHSPVSSALLSPRVSEPSHKPQLDGLRAVAVGMVILAHAGGRRFDAFGVYGVTLFFVLSAYLITGILLRSREQPLRGALRTFYARRFLRIFPAYYVVLVVLVAIDAPTMRATWPWHAAYLSNWLAALTGWYPLGVAHLWTLSVEEQFYLGWPLLVLLIPLRHLGRVCVALAMLAVVSRGMLAIRFDEHQYVITPTVAVLDAFAIGAMLAWHPAPRAALHWCLAVGALVVVHAIYARAAGRGYVPLRATEGLGVAIVAAWVIDAAARSRLWRGFALRPVRYVGTISYGIYLWHFPIVWLIQRAVRDDPMLRETARGGWALVLVVSLLTLGVASASWFALEQPCNRLKRLFPYHRA